MLFLLLTATPAHEWSVGAGIGYAQPGFAEASLAVERRLAEPLWLMLQSSGFLSGRAFEGSAIG